MTSHNTDCQDLHIQVNKTKVFLVDCGSVTMTTDEEEPDVSSRKRSLHNAAHYCDRFQAAAPTASYTSVLTRIFYQTIRIVTVDTLSCQM